MALGVPELTEEQIEAISKAAEDAARRHIFFKVKQKQVKELSISVEAEGTKPVRFEIEVDLFLSPNVEGINDKSLAEEAVKVAFAAVEEFLRKLT